MILVDARETIEIPDDQIGEPEESDEPYIAVYAGQALALREGLDLIKEEINSGVLREMPWIKDSVFVKSIADIEFPDENEGPGGPEDYFLAADVDPDQTMLALVSLTQAARRNKEGHHKEDAAKLLRTPVVVSWRNSLGYGNVEGFKEAVL